MELDAGRHDVLTLRDYVAVVRRRKWTIVATVVLFTAAVIAYTTSQSPLYAASADVLLSRQNPVQNLTGATPDQTAVVQPDRFVRTQAQIARAPAVAVRAAKSVHNRVTPGALLASSTVAPVGDADFMRFTVTEGSPALARQLATAYASAFTAYRRALDARNVGQARKSLEARVNKLEQSGDTKSTLYATLVDRLEQLRTLEVSLPANATVVRAATGALKTRPKPVRNAFLGFGVSLILGVLLAFLFEALDTRVRSTNEARQRVALPLLARIPAISRRLRGDTALAMIDEPDGLTAESFRMLRTNLEIANLDRGARTIMVTSSVDGEGASTTAANLAVSLARAGRRVVLVDLDLRHASLGRFFDAEGRPGVTDVALGRVPLDAALLNVAITEADTEPATSGNGHAPLEGMLQVLTSGHVPADPGEFVSTHALATILGELRARADVVLIDTPGILEVGDATTLSANVDAVLVVSRLKIARRPMLDELRHVLESVPAAKLGLVVTGVDPEEVFSSDSGSRRIKPDARPGRLPTIRQKEPTH